MTVNKNTPYHVTAIGLFILLKFSYTIARTEDLTFLLSPTSKVIGLITGSKSAFIQDSGYFHPQLNILIDKSCSGFNFLLLCFLMLSFLALKYFQTKISKTLALTFSLIGASLITIFVNSSRILTALVVQSQSFSITQHPLAHEVVGIITNLTFLILIYLSVEKVLLKQTMHAKPL